MVAGEVALVQFPFAKLSAAQLRPVLLLNRLPGPYDDWLVCMISTTLRQYQSGIDEIIGEQDSDFVSSGLKAPSLLRCTRLMVVEASLLPGAIGSIGPERMKRIRQDLSSWLLSD